MSPGISVSLHFWRGCGPDIQRDLFVWRYRLGLLTLSVERADVLAAYRKIRAAAQEALDTMEGR